MKASHPNITTQSSGLMRKLRERKRRTERSKMPDSRLRTYRAGARCRVKAVVRLVRHVGFVPAFRSQRFSGAQQIREDSKGAWDARRQLPEPGNRGEHVCSLAVARIQCSTEQRLLARVVRFK